MSAGSTARWLFTNRRTGGITIVQGPNTLSTVSTVAAVAGAVLPGRPGRVARQVRDGAAVAWALDELARGVNPWRRAVGAAALCVEVWRFSRR
jgi:hypothetical protein